MNCYELRTRFGARGLIDRSELHNGLARAVESKVAAFLLRLFQQLHYCDPLETRQNGRVSVGDVLQFFLVDPALYEAR